jgi:altronate hydrolase
MKQKVLKVHPSDNVIVALQDLPKGEQITYNGSTYTLVDDIPAKHKFFEKNMAAGDEVVMYGVLVGKAQNEIPSGGIMNTSNVKHAAEGYDYRNVQYSWQAPDVSKFKNRTFNGYHRSDGRVGTANYWLFIPTVFCENRNLDVIKEALHNELGYGVTGKYKQYAHQLAEAIKNGSSLETIDFAPTANNQNRVFKNVEPGRLRWHSPGRGYPKQVAGFVC